MLTIVSTEFAKAERIEFWLPEDIQKEPGAIILVFSKEQASASNARGCYNYLLGVTDSKTTLLKIERKKKSINISFVDTKRKIDIEVKGLSYKKEQANEFLEKYPKDISFAFLLGLPNNNDRPLLIATKENFEILTLGGVIE